MRTQLYDANNVLIKDFGQLPTIPAVGDCIGILNPDNNTWGMWNVTGRSFFLDPTVGTGVVCLSGVYTGHHKPNAITL